MLKERLSIEGILPERAVLRLKREGISVYNAKKTKKNQILLSVKKKDTEKVFAIYPNVCYNSYEHSSYKITRVGADASTKLLGFLKKRVGLIVGAALCLPLCFYADGYVLSVKVEGETSYQREVLTSLEKWGIAPYKRYDEKNLDLICAEILSLDGVGFCAVKKNGTTVTVEVRNNPFASPSLTEGGMFASRSGTLVSLSVLRGTPLKKLGDEVKEGDILVGDYFLAGVEGTEKIPSTVVARARFACAYEETVAAETEEEAFAKAYLALALSERSRIVSRSAAEGEDGYLVKIEYEEVQTLNF